MLQKINKNLLKFNFNNGFTLIEIMLVIAIMALVGGGIPVISSYIASTNLRVAEQEYLQTLRRAQSYALSNEYDSEWGVAIQSNQIILFSGTSYATRDTSKDEALDVHSSLTASGTQEVVFDQYTGYVTSAIITELILNENETKTITVSQKGVIEAY